MATQVARCFHRRACPPGRDHLRRDIGEHAAGQADRTDGLELADLGQHRVQADVARLRPDRSEHRRTVDVLDDVIAVRLVVGGGGHQSEQAATDRLG